MATHLNIVRPAPPERIPRQLPPGPIPPTSDGEGHLRCDLFVTTETARNAIYEQTRLVTLHLSTYGGVQNSPMNAIAEAHASSLTSLTLSDVADPRSVIRCIRDLTSLQRLTLVSGCRLATPPHSGTLFRQVGPRLTSVGIEDIQLPHPDLASVLGHCTALTELSLDETTEIDDAGARAIAASPTGQRLEKLDIWGTSIRDAGVLAIARQCTNLVRLHLGSNLPQTTISGDVVAPIISEQRLTRLTHLSMTFIAMNPGPTIDLLAHLTALRSLCLTQRQPPVTREEILERQLDWGSVDDRLTSLTILDS
jgi:hypothetical protein